MNNYKHCDLCENRLFNIFKGITCGINRKPPGFKDKCDRIRFENRLEEAIKQINTELSLVNRTRSGVYFTFSLYLFITTILLLIGFFLLKFTLSKGLITIVPILILGISLYTFPKAFNPLRKFHNRLDLANSKKRELDEILTLYKIKYEIDIVHTEDTHGNVYSEASIKYL